MTEKKTGKKKKKRKKNDIFSSTSPDNLLNICANASCRLRKAGCRGFEGCPGYKAKE